jgi:predicted ATPase/DNA-binding CsgD family transcriptional regulator
VTRLARLTPRQRQVVGFVVEGYTNRQIAARLGISARTAETHLDEIRNKLGVRTRAEIAAWAAAQGGGPGWSRDDTGALHRPLAAQVPVPLTTFVGRTVDLRRLRDLAGRSRLLTLWGPGGSGKTRLALQLAADVTVTGQDPVCVVDLGRTDRSGLVPYALAEALGVREDLRESLSDSIARRLAAGRALIILDTCEHHLSEVADVVLGLAERCPGVRFVATSREPLAVPGERLYRVPPLSVPDAEGGLESVARSEAVQLFTDRAKAFVPEFELSDGNVADVARVCRSLDGLPLAIELAVADLKMLSVAQLAGRLADSLGLLSRGPRGWPDRHRTLDAVISWSHDRLAGREQTVFRRLAVFRSRFDFSAATAVCVDDHVGTAQAEAALAELVSRSLVMAEDGACRLLDTVREFASRRLAEAGEADSAHRKLAEHCLAAQHSQTYPGRGQAAAGAQDVNADLETALAWCETGDTDLGLRLAIAAAQRWAWRGYPTEARHWVERMARTVPRPSPTAARAELEIARIASVHGDYGALRGHLHAAMRAMGPDPDPGLLAVARRLQGLAAYNSGEHAEAIFAFQGALRTARESGDRWAQAQALYHAGCALASAGHLEQAQAHLHQSISIRNALGVRGPSMMTLTVLAMVTLKQGDAESARVTLKDALDIALRTGDKRVLASLDVAACLAAASGDVDSAFRLTGASARLLEQSGLQPQPDWTRTVTQTLEPVRNTIAAGDLENLTAQGRAMSAEEAIGLAVAVIETGAGAVSMPAAPAPAGNRRST